MRVFSKIFLAIVIILVFLGVFLALSDEAHSPAEVPSLTSDECLEAGGVVINTLSEKKEYAPEQILGAVTDLKCPCICISE